MNQHFNPSTTLVSSWGRRFDISPESVTAAYIDELLSRIAPDFKGHLLVSCEADEKIGGREGALSYWKAGPRDYREQDFIVLTLWQWKDKPKRAREPDPAETAWQRQLREEDEREPLEPARGPLAVLIDLADECEGFWRDWDKGTEWLREQDAYWRAELGVGLMGTRPPGLPRPVEPGDDPWPEDEQTTSDEWPEPVDLWAIDGGGLAEKAPRLTQDMLPKAIADYAFDVAERMGLEPAMACVPGLRV